MATHRSKAMSDEEWADKYGDKPRPKGSRGRSRLRHGRQSTDVNDVIRSFQPGDEFNAELVWGMFTADTQADWSAAYGSIKACVMKVRHVLSNIASGNTYGPILVRDGKTYTYEPVVALEPKAADAYPAHVGMAVMAQAEAEASVALDGETQSVPPPALDIGDYTCIGTDFDDRPLYVDTLSGDVGVFEFVKILR